MISGRTWLHLILAAGLGLGLIALFVWPQDVLTVRLPRHENRLAQAVTTASGDRVLLTYIHSVEGAQVQGWFQVTKGPGLVALETRMDSVGTGLPNSAPQRTHREGDFQVVDEKEKPLDGIRFFWSKHTNPHLESAGNEIDLRQLKTGSLILVRPERISLGRYLLWRVWGRPWPARG
jgi:hypothetical protein